MPAAAGRAGEGGQHWCAAQFWLGCLAMPLAGRHDAALGHLTAARDALAGHPVTPLLARVLAWRAGTLANLGRASESAEEARRSLALAREPGDPAAEVEALYWLAGAAHHAADHETALACMRQARRIDQGIVPGIFVRGCNFVLAATLIESGQFEAAREACDRGLDLARQVGEDRTQAESR